MTLSGHAYRERRLRRGPYTMSGACGGFGWVGSIREYLIVDAVYEMDRLTFKCEVSGVAKCQSSSKSDLLAIAVRGILV